MMQKSHVVFDLDGTLIDSAPAILASFRDAFEACNRTPQQPLTQEIIGPPLIATLEMLAGTKDAEALTALAKAFTDAYDNGRYRETTVFPGIESTLQGLAGRSMKLHVATNKRFLPTTRILTHLRWDGVFDSIYAPDKFTPPLKSKSELLRLLLTEQRIAHTDALYIGDRREDGEAAAAAHIAFLFAKWGYQSNPGLHWPAISQPTELLDL